MVGYWRGGHRQAAGRHPTPPTGGSHERHQPDRAAEGPQGAHYPASKDDLVSCAEGNHADSGMRDKISSIPSKSYENPAEVEKAVFKDR